MSDIYSKDKRSEIMSKVASKDTKPEIFVRKFLFNRGFRYRKNVNNLPGKPDIVLPKYKTVIFINGCFWHGHIGCKKSKLPKTRELFWKEKIENNISRDKRNYEILESLGWHIIVLWECQIRKSNLEVLEQLEMQIKINISGK